jgi:hypothetical protein
MARRNWTSEARWGVSLVFLMLLLIFAAGFEGWEKMSDAEVHDAEVMHRATLFEESVDTARLAQIDFEKQVQEWKDLLLRGNNPVSFGEYREAFIKQGEATQADLHKLKVLFDQLGFDTHQVDEALQAHRVLEVRYLEALKQYVSLDSNSAHLADATVNGLDRALTEMIGDIASYIVIRSSQMHSIEAAKSEASHMPGTNVLSYAIVAAMVLVEVAMGWLVHKMTTSSKS